MLTMIEIAGFIFLLVVCIFFIVQRRLHLSESSPIVKDALFPNSKICKAAILFSKSGPYTVVHCWPRPIIQATELLIKVHTIGLNPIDWKCVAYGFGVHSLPWISGREGSGIVEEVGQDVRGFEKGDRVFFTSTNYRDNRTSAFQQYVAATSYNVGKLPDFLSFEDGATIGVGCVAAAESLFNGLSVPLPFQRDEGSHDSAVKIPQSKTESPWILVWGGSCVTGIMVTQLAKQNGYRVLAVAGLQNAPYLESIGADRIVDRHKPQAAIDEAQNLQVKLGVDCVGKETATWALQALHPKGRLAYLVKGPDQSAIAASDVVVTDILIKRFHEDPRYGQSLMEYISSGLTSRRLRPVRYEQISGGFDALQKGLDALKSDNISGKKLVLNVSESSKSEII